MRASTRNFTAFGNPLGIPLGVNRSAVGCVRWSGAVDCGHPGASGRVPGGVLEVVEVEGTVAADGLAVPPSVVVRLPRSRSARSEAAVRASGLDGAGVDRRRGYGQEWERRAVITAPERRRRRTGSGMVRGRAPYVIDARLHGGRAGQNDRPQQSGVDHAERRSPCRSSDAQQPPSAGRGRLIGGALSRVGRCATFCQ